MNRNRARHPVTTLFCKTRIGHFVLSYFTLHILFLHLTFKYYFCTPSFPNRMSRVVIPRWTARENKLHACSFRDKFLFKSLCFFRAFKDRLTDSLSRNHKDWVGPTVVTIALLVCPPQQRKAWLQPAVREAEGRWVGLPSSIYSDPNEIIRPSATGGKSSSKVRVRWAFHTRVRGSIYCIEIGSAITALRGRFCPG